MGELKISFQIKNLKFIAFKNIKKLNFGQTTQNTVSTKFFSRFQSWFIIARGLEIILTWFNFDFMTRTFNKKKSSNSFRSNGTKNHVEHHFFHGSAKSFCQHLFRTLLMSANRGFKSHFFSWAWSSSYPTWWAKWVFRTLQNIRDRKKVGTNQIHFGLN